MDKKTFLLFPDDAAIQYKRGAEELAQVQVVSDLLRAADMPQATNDKLVNELTKLLCITEKDLYLQGFNSALQLTKPEERGALYETTASKG